MFQGRRQFAVWLAMLGLLLGGLLTAGCLGSPTLPLPPPSPELPTVPVDGQTRIAGNVPVHNIGVRVLALNTRSNRIFGQSTATNRFSFLAQAVSGDTFVIWYTVGDEDSETIEVTVPYPTGESSSDEPATDGGAGDAG
jgi:hypothetical protein